jgi:hypothetical protein
MPVCVGIMTKFVVIGDVPITKESTYADVRRSIDTNKRLKELAPEQCVMAACAGALLITCEMQRRRTRWLVLTLALRAARAQVPARVDAVLPPCA